MHNSILIQFPGTLKERGILEEEAQKDFMKAAEKDTKDAADAMEGDDKDKEEDLEEGMEVYHLPWVPERIQTSRLSKVLRIFPGKTAFHVLDKAKNGKC